MSIADNAQWLASIRCPKRCDPAFILLVDEREEQMQIGHRLEDVYELDLLCQVCREEYTRKNVAAVVKVSLDQVMAEAEHLMRHPERGVDF